MNQSALNRDHWQLLKDGKRIRVYQSHLEDGSPVVVKTYGLTGPLRSFSFHRKRRTLERFYREVGDEFPLPELISAGTVSPPRLGYLCFRLLQGQDFRRVPWSRMSSTEKALLTQQAGSLLGKLHHFGWVHGDYKFGNLMESGGDIYLLDLESARETTSMSARGRDLARFLLNGVELGLAEEDLAAFWVCYRTQWGQGWNRLPEAGITRATRHWLAKLSRRHEKYQHPDAKADLAFLQEGAPGSS
ncbi:lipopolysaccharide kinase InaA family protein [Gilvimarinus sp. F26214L]|uniref:lipopolysaccharide kinase InaA family protein n=1 Tax=Gilvimarinus sp. DZF01 TaxID=3461371 RepID=UPI004046821D